jgi:hypothetical protein
MIKTIKRKIFSMVAITYAFTSVQAIADVKDQYFEDQDDFMNGGENVKLALDQYSYVRTREVLSSDFEDGSSFEWQMKNEFDIFNTAIPFGYNDKGLTIHSKIDNEGTFVSDDVFTRKIKSNDFPAWILSKYTSIDEIKDGIADISISNESNLALSYEITDAEENSVNLIVKNGDLVVI